MLTHTPRGTIISAVAAVVAIGAVPSPAAAHNGGVASTTFYGVDMECTESQPLPCPPDADHGPANTIFISQNVVDGELQFDTVTTTSQIPGAVWVQSRIGAECRTGYRLHSVYVSPGGFAYDPDQRYGPGDPDEVLDEHTFFVPHPDAKRMPEKDQALHFPIDAIVGTPDFNIGDADGLLELAENEVAARVAAGEDEAAVRAAGFDMELVKPFTAAVECEGIVRGVRWLHKLRVDIPIDLVFLGDELEPGVGGSTPTLPEAEPTQVTQATLSVLEHPSDPCAVVASGTFVTNAPTTVDYRIVDDRGQHSQVFSVDVDHTHVAFVSHDVDLPPAPAVPSRGSLVTPSPDGGDIDGFSVHPTDKVSGVLTIEVLSPNAMESNPDGFRLPPCTPPQSATLPAMPGPALSRS